MLIHIDSGYFCAGYDLETGRIAPIIAYMKGWSIDRIKGYCAGKGCDREAIGHIVVSHSLNGQERISGRYFICQKHLDMLARSPFCEALAEATND